MIKFFRKIRQKLLTENKFSKYLIYALGEILLVMIGILLALQINNWNQNRLNDIEEQRILIAISEELKLSKFLFNRGSTVQENKIQAAKNLLKEMQIQNEKLDNEMLNEDIDRLTQRWISGTPTSIYDALIGSGDLKLITSEELRKRLALFKSDQEFLRLFEEIQIKFEDDQLSPFLNQNINRGAFRLRGNASSWISDIPLTPYKSSYGLLLDNMEFSNLLVELIEHSSRVLRTYERLERHVHKLDSLVKSGYSGIENRSNMDTK